MSGWLKKKDRLDLEFKEYIQTYLSNIKHHYEIHPHGLHRYKVIKVTTFPDDSLVQESIGDEYYNSIDEAKDCIDNELAIEKRAKEEKAIKYP